MRLITLFVLSVIFSFSNCQPNKPASDSTPPVVRWVVENTQTGVTTKITGSDKIDAKFGDTFNVTEIVEDPEGVQYIELSGNREWGCSVGEAAQSHGPTIEAAENQTFSPNSEGKVSTTALLVRDVNPTTETFRCDGEFKFDGGVITIFGKGRNYFNGETKAQLRFGIPN